MKVGVEDAIAGLGFPQAVVLRPGFLMGDREVAHAGGPLLGSLFSALGTYVSRGARDRFAQDAEVVARAAVRAAALAAEGKAPSKFWVLEQGDIVRLGRDEWVAA